MANQTIAQQIAVLEARRDALQAALLAACTTGAAKSVTLGPMSYTAADHASLSKELAQVERDLQRLYRGGRGIVVDHSAGSEGTDDLSSDNTVYTRVNA